MKLRCLLGGHDWIVGRVACSDARRLVPQQESYHNRACRHCGKEEWNADKVELEADRTRNLRGLLKETERVAKLKAVGDRPCDPKEFP